MQTGEEKKKKFADHRQQITDNDLKTTRWVGGQQQTLDVPFTLLAYI